MNSTLVLKKIRVFTCLVTVGEEEDWNPRFPAYEAGEMTTSLLLVNKTLRSLLSNRRVF